MPVTSAPSAVRIAVSPVTSGESSMSPAMSHDWARKSSGPALSPAVTLPSAAASASDETRPETEGKRPPCVSRKDRQLRQAAM